MFPQIMSKKFDDQEAAVEGDDAVSSKTGSTMAPSMAATDAMEKLKNFERIHEGQIPHFETFEEAEAAFIQLLRDCVRGSYQLECFPNAHYIHNRRLDGTGPGNKRCATSFISLCIER